MNDTREEQLLNAGKAADAEKRTDVESLKKKYAASDEKAVSYTHLDVYKKQGMHKRVSFRCGASGE